ncbi:MAG: helix-hairpin-helix domain-containing protein [Chitinophagales bacterium]
MKTSLNRFFVFTKTEQRGAIALVTVCCALLALPSLLNQFFPPKFTEPSAEQQQLLAAFQQKYMDALRDTLPPWGSDHKTAFSTADNKKSYHKNWRTERKHVQATTIVEINSADSATFEHLRGIGAFTAAKIIAYRNALGGFIAVQQLKEVYGMRDSVYEQLRPQFTINRQLVKPINVNTADYETLRRHPYIKGWIAKWIVSYRKNSGNFTSVDDLTRVSVINDSLLRRMRPYVTVE